MSANTFVLPAWTYASPSHCIKGDNGDVLCYFYGCNEKGTAHGLTPTNKVQRFWCPSHLMAMRSIRKHIDRCKKYNMRESLVRWRFAELLNCKQPDMGHLHQLGIDIKLLRHPMERGCRRTNTNIMANTECQATGCLQKALDRFCTEHTVTIASIANRYTELETAEDAISLLCEEIAFHKTTSNYRVAAILELIHKLTSSKERSFVSILGLQTQ